MKLFGYTFTLNEEHMIKYVLPYLDRMGYDKLVVYDSGSTDRTVEILSKVPYIEIRDINCEEGDLSFVKLNKQYECFYECKKYSEEHGGEDVWMTFTDFDEVIFALNGIYKNAKDMFSFHVGILKINYDYFCDRMAYLFYEGNNYDGNKPIHYDVSNIRCSNWYSFGSKVTMIKVNDFELETAVVGNHSLTVRKTTENNAINLINSGLFYGFNLKYINKSILEINSKNDYETLYKRFSPNIEDFYMKRTSEYNELYSTSYSLSQYFSVRGMHVKDNDGMLKTQFGYNLGGLTIL